MLDDALDQPRIPGLVVTDAAALRQWMDSDEHNFNCIGFSEGQLCCLDRILDPPPPD